MWPIDCGDQMAAAAVPSGPGSDDNMAHALFASLLSEIESRSEWLHTRAAFQVERIGQGQDADRIKAEHLVIDPEGSGPTVAVKIGFREHQGYVLLLGPLDCQLLGTLGPGRGQSHVRPLLARPVERIEDTASILCGIGKW